MNVGMCLMVSLGTHLGIKEHQLLIPLWDTGLPVICSCVHHKLLCHRAPESLLISCSMSSLVLCDYRLICHPTWLTWVWELGLRTPCLTGKHLHTQSFSIPILNVLRIWNTLTVLLSESISLEVPKITARVCNFMLLCLAFKVWAASQLCPCGNSKSFNQFHFIFIREWTWEKVCQIKHNCFYIVIKIWGVEYLDLESKLFLKWY